MYSKTDCSGRLTENCYSNLFTHYASKYGEIIDVQDTSKGKIIDQLMFLNLLSIY